MLLIDGISKQVLNQPEHSSYLSNKILMILLKAYYSRILLCRLSNMIVSPMLVGLRIGKGLECWNDIDRYILRMDTSILKMLMVKKYWILLMIVSLLLKRA